LDDFRIPIEKFTYGTTNIRNQWLTLLDQVHFLGVSVSINVQICFDKQQEFAIMVLSGGGASNGV